MELITPHLGLVKPDMDSTLWGDDVNNNFDKIDAECQRLDGAKAPTNHTHPDHATTHHTHGIDDIDDIQTELESKSDKIHEHDVDNIYFQEKVATLDGIGLPKTRPKIALLTYLQDTMIDTLPMMHTHHANDIEGLEHLFTDISGDETAIISQLGLNGEARSVCISVCLRRVIGSEGGGLSAMGNIIAEPFLQWEYGYEFRKGNSAVLPVNHNPYKNVNANNRIVIEKPMHSSGYWNDDGTTHLWFWCRGKHAINGSTAVALFEQIVIERPSLTSMLPIEELVAAMMKNPDFIKTISQTVAESYEEPIVINPPPNN